MHFDPLTIHQAVHGHLEPRVDGRGLSARTFCVEEFAGAGLPMSFVQCSTSFNTLRAKVRGMQFR